MTIDLTADPRVADLAARTAAFVRAVAVPEEERLSGVVGAGGEELRRSLQQAARDAGVFAPHVSREYGDPTGRRVLGRSEATQHTDLPKKVRTSANV